MNHCYHCGGSMELKPIGALEWRRVDGLSFFAPPDTPVPTCADCGEAVIPPEVEAEIDSKVEAEVSAHFCAAERHS